MQTMSRIDYLTDSAQPIAEELIRGSNLKLVLSAGVLVLSKLSPDKREEAIKAVNGGDPAQFSLDVEQDDSFRNGVRQVLKELGVHYSKGRRKS